jgi:hypothetical protein
LISTILIVVVSCVACISRKWKVNFSDVKELINFRNIFECVLNLLDQIIFLQLVSPFPLTHPKILKNV